MQVYLINLDRSEDRLAAMRKEFGRVGLPFTRFSGVDTREWPQEKRDAYFAERSFSPTERLPGDAGAFLSHLGVWKAIAESNGRAAAVFEDDVHLADDIAALLSDDDWLPDGADIVRLESNSRMVLKDGRSIPQTPGRKVYRAHSGTWGAAGYVITRDTAARLIALPPSTHTHIDWFLFKPARSRVAASLACYQVVPAPCIQDDYLHGAEAPMQSVVSHGVRRVPTPPRVRPWSFLIPRRKRPVPFQR